MHGDDDQVVPYEDSAPLAVQLVSDGMLKTYAGYPHGMATTHADEINADILAYIRGEVHRPVGPMLHLRSSSIRFPPDDHHEWRRPLAAAASSKARPCCSPSTPAIRISSSRWSTAARSRRAGASRPIRAEPPTNMPSGCTSCSSSKAYAKSDVDAVIIGTVVPRALHNLEVLAEQIFPRRAADRRAGTAAWPHRSSTSTSRRTSARTARSMPSPPTPSIPAT